MNNLWYFGGINFGNKNDHIDVVCFNCKSNNPFWAKFCNKCGIQLPLTCPHCENSTNLPEAVYCNQCGLQLLQTSNIKSDNLPEKEQQVSKSFNYDTFIEYALPEYNFKIKYHPDWEKIDGEDLKQLLSEIDVQDSNKVLVFRPPICRLHSSLFNSLFLDVSDLIVEMSLGDYIARNIYHLKSKYLDFQISESGTIEINGLIWHKLVYSCNGEYHLVLVIIFEYKVYMMGFVSGLDEHSDFVQDVEIMINSFELLYTKSISHPRPENLPTDKTNIGFKEFKHLEDGYKIKYPSLWVKSNKLHTNNTVMFGKWGENYSEDFTVYFGILVTVLNTKNTNSKDQLIMNKNSWKDKLGDFKVDEEMSTTLDGLPAIQFVYTEGDKKNLVIICINCAKVYYLLYSSSSKTFLDQLILAEQMISSFEFL